MRRVKRATGRGDKAGLTRADDAVDAFDTAHRRPAAMCVGAGHVVVYGNPGFVAAFGRESVGLPAREVLLGLPGEAFLVMDAVFRDGCPLATWIRRDGEDWRLTVRPRIDPGTLATYGVSFHLRARSDLPILVVDPAAS